MTTNFGWDGNKDGYYRMTPSYYVIFNDKYDTDKLEGTFTRKEVTKVVDTLLKIITESISKGETINLTGLGKFAIKEQLSRRYYNVHTDQIEYSTTKRVVVFTPNKGLYNRLLKD